MKREAIHKFGPPEIMNREHGRAIGSSDHATSGQLVRALRLADRLKRVGTWISMDGKGRRLGNILIEPLWRSLKYECFSPIPKSDAT